MSSEKIRKHKAPRREGTTIRFDREIRGELQRIADSERRSFSNLVENILADYVQAKKRARKEQLAVAAAWPNRSIHHRKNGLSAEA